MEKKTQRTLIIWTKRGFGVIAFLVWIEIILTLTKSGTPFMEQASYCIVGTIVTFGLLSAIYKGLEYWEQQSQE